MNAPPRKLRIEELPTPSILVDLNKLEANIREFGDAALSQKKQIWPMIKSHKSLDVARLQSLHGASGFLCGNLDEAEMLVFRGGYTEIMLAYPISSQPNLARCLRLARQAHVIIRIDSVEVASILESACDAEQLHLDYVIKVDTGVRRYGVAPQDTVRLAQAIKPFKHLRFIGIATHHGHVMQFDETGAREEAIKEVHAGLHSAKRQLETAGFRVDMVTCGSTPAFWTDIEDDLVTHVHPGTYVYHDAMQVGLGVVPIERCAMSILATVTSNQPRWQRVTLDAGVKILTSDTGGHGIGICQGFGIIKGHPNTNLSTLSEEVGWLDVSRDNSISVGDKLEIIPNHCCVANNQTSYLVGHQNGLVEKILTVDSRGGVNSPL